MEFKVNSIPQKGGTLMGVTTIVLDIVKQVFPIQGVDELFLAEDLRHRTTTGASFLQTATE
jgi:hypothetical protein